MYICVCVPIQDKTTIFQRILYATNFLNIFYFPSKTIATILLLREFERTYNADDNR